MNTVLFPVISQPTVNFLDALAAASGTFTAPFAATAVNNVYGLPNTGLQRWLIRAIEYMAVENIGLEFDFWASALGLTNLVASDMFISRYAFASSNGVQYGGTGLYRYYVDGLAIPYVDFDSVGSTSIAPTLHVGVQNVDTVAKSAGAPGAMIATFWMEPMMSVQG